MEILRFAQDDIGDWIGLENASFQSDELALGQKEKREQSSRTPKMSQHYLVRILANLI